MSLFRLETKRKTDSRLIGRLFMIGLALFVAGHFLAPWIVAYDYKVISSGDKVHHARYPGTVEEINELGEVKIKTFDNKFVTVPYEEVIEQ
jgi:hypothetical protein